MLKKTLSVELTHNYEIKKNKTRYITKQKPKSCEKWKTILNRNDIEYLLLNLCPIESECRLTKMFIIRARDGFWFANPILLTSVNKTNLSPRIWHIRRHKTNNTCLIMQMQKNNSNNTQVT